MMILEHALLQVTPGREQEYEESVRQALPIISAAPNCFGAEIRRQEENPSTYLLLIRWSSIDAHMAFRETELFTKWRELTHHFYVEAPRVTHFHDPVGS